MKINISLYGLLLKKYECVYNYILSNKYNICTELHLIC